MIYEPHGAQAAAGGDDRYRPFLFFRIRSFQKTFLHYDQLQHRYAQREHEPFRNQPSQIAHQEGRGRGAQARRGRHEARGRRKAEGVRHRPVFRRDDDRQVRPPYRHARQRLSSRRHRRHPLPGCRLHARAALGGQEDPTGRPGRLQRGPQLEGGRQGGGFLGAEHHRREGDVGAGHGV